jgi:hypothetical protein
LGKYWNVREDLHVNKDIIFRNRQIVVPQELRRQLLRSLHLDHGGTTKTLAKAREVIYWPDMNNEITQMIEDCNTC